MDFNMQRDPAGDNVRWGTLAGALASERMSQALKGSFRMLGNHSKSAKAEGSLTVTPDGWSRYESRT
ncbi:hypothetical protein EUBVEN_00038 [Eubacterium ventriosum ATCC 27560]|uniref:Uncharacterized protein n=1 Tax=Eubacterium ventriosum ATCC 27560 TaxID=411463 RepID=A5Z308_9FIRM|nr:hypothetical protein EUBVEN_00038 [Eubacterium ventriosum ATCC 27560]